MERKADHPPPLIRSSNPSRPISSNGAEAANPTSSTSSSSTAAPDFLRQVHAAFKRHRTLGTMQSTMPRASRVLVSQTESSRSKAPSASLAANNATKKFSRAPTRSGDARLIKAGFDKKKDNAAAEMGMDSPDDSSITPSITGTLTSICNEQKSVSGIHKGDVVVSSSHPTNPVVSAEDDNLNKEGKGHLRCQAAITDRDLKQQDPQKMEISNTAMNFGESSMIEGKDEPRKNQHFLDPMARSMVMGSSSFTTMSVHTGPISQCTIAPLSGQTAVQTQMSSTAVETSAGVPILERGNMAKEGNGLDQYKQASQLGEAIKENRTSGNVGYLKSEVPSANILSNVPESSQSSKIEKASRKKKYDHDFFKVNGKLYQKLGKIGSGGSSEVHKVISSDCIIYALKKIKLKGRDYPTAYGFCQEIEYLKKLKGKRNIIQLIDYEVTDKTLLQEVMNDFMTTKEGRIKDDQYIYMVLEYGEIDLANMLSQKWREIDISGGEINENWLRFYWQQMLEAVNTIHEERIVHSDLKPANFLLVRGSLKLIDFGIAKAILNDTTNIQRDAQVGTLNYMSPEAFLCNDEDIKCGRPSDIWSLGCILFQMVYGKTPFSAYKTFVAKFKVIADKNHEIIYEPVSNPWLIDLMRRCLAWDRNDRWRIPQLLRHPFLVPPIPSELSSPVQDHGICKILVERIREYCDEPEVSRLCNELQVVVANLDRARKH